MKHELRVERKFRWQTKGFWLIRRVIGKFGTQSNETAIDPTKDVAHFVRFRLKDCQAGREDGGCFLIKGLADRTVCHAGVGGLTIRDSWWVVPWSTHGRGTNACATIGVLVLRQELNVPSLAIGEWRITWIGNIKVNGNRCAWIESTNRPGSRAALADFQIRDSRPVLVQTGDGTNGATDFEFARRHDFETGTKGHGQLTSFWRILRMTRKDTTKRFLKDGLSKRISQNRQPTGRFDQLPHFQQSDLIEGTRKDIHNMIRLRLFHHSRLLLLRFRIRRHRRWIRQFGIILARWFVQRFGLFRQISMGPHVLLLEARHDSSWSTGARTTGKEHDAGAPAGHAQLEEGGGDAEGTSGSARYALVVGDRPRVLAQIFQNRFEDETAFRNGQEETLQHLTARCNGWLTLLLLSLLDCLCRLTTQQFTHTAWCILAIATHDVGLAKAIKAQFVHLHIGTKGNETDEGFRWQQIQSLRQTIGQLRQFFHVNARIDNE
mmetsp:Transcript_11562/g.19255  ORF Transcript_11562/g.19255 Transcript_11562/m.19255 type:complete len:491 (+) Transcript_11562:716-2188(+)